MGKKVNPIAIRIPKFRSWPYLWHSKYTFTPVLLQDLFIRKYLKEYFRGYRIILSKCLIKRSIKATYISLSVFNLNYNINYQFKHYMFARSYKVIRSLFDHDCSRLAFAISRVFNTGRVVFFLRYVVGQKPNFKAVALTADPVILGTYFIRKYKYMYAYKKILKAFKGVYGTLSNESFHLKGLRVQISGPVGAPRNRMARRITKYFYGVTPLQTFCSLITYAVRSRSLGDGVVTAKFWLYKSLPKFFLLEKPKLFRLIRVALNAVVRVARRGDFYIRKNRLPGKHHRRTDPRRFGNLRFLKLFRTGRRHPEVPYCFMYDTRRKDYFCYMRTRPLFAAMAMAEHKFHRYYKPGFVRQFYGPNQADLYAMLKPLRPGHIIRPAPRRGRRR